MAAELKAPHETPELPDIDSFLQPSHDEYARRRAVATIHAHALLNLRFELRRPYELSVLPRFEREHARGPRDGAEVARAMEAETCYRFYSSIRYNAQEMNAHARQPILERALPQMIEVARAAAARNPAGGSLSLNPALPIPRYVSELDVHLLPGGTHSEFAPDDVAQGAMLGVGLSTNAGQGRIHQSRNFAGIGASIAFWLQQKYPDFRPRRVLDMGTTWGANLFAYTQAFGGCEAYGIDVAAPGLRYGHAKAAHAGIPVHFSQQNAEQTSFSDGFFDLIVSSFFLHEVPLAATRRILAETHRLLAPGGILAFMELPPHKSCDAFLNFAYDWDTRNNNEPFYAQYRAQDPTELTVAAGYPPTESFEVTIPDVTTYDMSLYPRFLRGELAAPAHGRGGWFIFGSRKRTVGEQES